MSVTLYRMIKTIFNEARDWMLYFYILFADSRVDDVEKVTFDGEYRRQ